MNRIERNFRTVIEICRRIGVDPFGPPSIPGRVAYLAQALADQVWFRFHDTIDGPRSDEFDALLRRYRDRGFETDPGSDKTDPPGSPEPLGRFAEAFVFGMADLTDPPAEWGALTGVADDRIRSDWIEVLAWVLARSDPGCSREELIRRTAPWLDRECAVLPIDRLEAWNVLDFRDL